MELTPLQTAIASNVLASGILAFAFFYLWFQRREARAPMFWGAAYLCYCVRQVMILLYAPAGPPLAADLLFIAVPLLILAGTLRFLDRRVPYRLLAGASVVFTLGAMAGYYGVIPRQAVWLPIMLASATLVLFTTGGLLLVHNHRRPSQAHVILAVLFVLWGALLASFPLLLHSMPLRMGYYLANAVALLLIALALIIASQRQQYRVALDAQRAAETANQRFQDVVDTATAWIWEWDAERRIRFISPQVRDSLGIPPEEFIGRRFRDVPGIARLDLSLEDAGRIFTAARPFRNVLIDVLTDAGRRVRISVTGKPTFDSAGRHTGFRGITLDVTAVSRLQTTLEAVTRAAAASTGADYFRVLVEHLTQDLGVDHAVIGRRVGEGRIRTLAWYGAGEHHADVEYDVEGTPCAATLAQHLSIVETGAADLYPRDTMLRELGIDGYVGVALRNTVGEVIGLIVVLSKARIADRDLIQTVLTAIAPRAGAELERQMAEEARRSSETLLRTLIDNMPIGFYMMDTAGRYVLRNRTLAEWSGVETRDVLGRTIREAAGARGDEYANIDAEVEEVIATRRTLVRERDFVALDGNSRPALVSRFPIFDSAGRVTHIATFINDLSNVRSLEAQVREREALFHTVLDHMPIGFLLTEPEGRITLVNRVMNKWAYLDRDKVLGHTLGEIAGQLPYDTAPVEASLREVVRTGQPVIYERLDNHADGQERAVLINRYPILDDAGKVRYVASLLTDLTEVRRLEAQVREREELFGTILDHMPIGFHLTDLDGRFVMRNRVIDEWSGIGRHEVLGRTHRHVADRLPYDYEKVEAELKEVAATRQPVTAERTDRHRDGRERPLLIHRYPVFNGAGDLRYVASLLTDLTEVKKLQAEVLGRERLFRTVIDNAPIAFQITDAQSRRMMINHTMLSWSGGDEASLLGRTPRESGLDPAACDRIEHEIAEVAARHKTLAYEGTFRAFEGDAKPALVYRFPIVDASDGGTLVGTIAVDLTELKQLQRQIIEREALFRAVIDHMPIGFHLTDRDGRFVMRNRITDAWTGVSSADALGKVHRELPGYQQSNLEVIEEELHSVVASGEPMTVERVNHTADGRERRVLITRYPILDPAGAVLYVASAQTDLTDIRQLEQEVREREQLFRTVIDNMPVAFHMTDADGRVVQRNRTHDMWGNEIVLGQSFSEMDEINITPEDRAIVDAEIRGVRETGQTLVRERTDMTRNGERPVLVCRFPIFDTAGKVKLVASMVTDVSDLKRLEDQVRQSETRLQRIVAALDRSQKGVVVEDASNRPIYINRTASELMGNESSAVVMLERAGIGAEFESHGAWTGEVIHRTRSGNDAILQTSVSRLPDGGSVTLLDDATERLERERRQTALERQVQEAQKMDAVGQLAGGIAHDFNNLIGAILGFARFIAEDTDETSRLHGYATRILSASQRARDLIQQILAFSRRENAPRQPAAVSKLVEESAQLLRATVPATLDIEVRNDFPEAWSLVNQTQITQILVNLCLNAADAMGGKPGTLTLALERLPDVDPRLRWLLASDPGGLPRVDLAESAGAPSRCYVGALRTGSPYLVLSARDQGSGIPAAQLAKIFDPFFTTKPLGQGTGLGLSVVQRLVLAHDGAVVVTTQPGIGTTFDIILPVSGRSSRDIVEAVTRDDPAMRRAPVEEGSRGRVLVVDDDQHFGDMVSTALDRAGYEVGVCSRPREAIEVFSQGPRRWDMLVTDQTMPEMSGLEMIGRLKTLNPALRCILCTGYAVGGLNAATAQAGGADVFFHKPVDVEALITAIAGLTTPDAGRKKSGRPS